MRKHIEQIIQQNAGNQGEAAMAICVYLEYEIGLAGNGWFDDDPVLRARLKEAR